MSIYRQISMTEWHTLSGRFTDEEIEVIQKFQKKQNLSDNQLIRQGVQLAVSILAMKDLFEGPDLTFFRSFAEEFKTTMNSPEYQKVMSDSVERVALKYKEEQLKQFEKEAKQLTSQLDVFNKKRKRGPKPIKRKAGRPKDTGT